MPRLARRPSSPVSPSRSDSSPSSAAPTWLQTPWPSATTSNRGPLLVACTGRVTLLVGGCDRQTAASSLVGRVPCYLAPACSAPTRNSWARRRRQFVVSARQSGVIRGWLTWAATGDLGTSERFPLVVVLLGRKAVAQARVQWRRPECASSEDRLLDGYYLDVTACISVIAIRKVSRVGEDGRCRLSIRAASRSAYTSSALARS